MKNAETEWKKAILPLVIMTLLFSANNFSLHSGDTIYLTNGEWPPYYSEFLPGYGFDSQIVSEAFALVGYNAKYDFFPWTRALKNAEEGNMYHGGVGWGSGPDFLKDFFVSDTTSRYSMVFFYRKDSNFQWNGDYASLEGMRIGLTQDYDYPDELLETAEKGLTEIEWEAQDVRNFRKLLANRIDLYVDDIRVGVRLMNRIFTPAEISAIAYRKTALNTDNLHVVLTKNKPGNALLIILFNEGLKQLKESGRYDEIIEQSLKGISPEEYGSLKSP